MVRVGALEFEYSRVSRVESTLPQLWVTNMHVDNEHAIVDRRWSFGVMTNILFSIHSTAVSVLSSVYMYSGCGDLMCS